METDELIRYPEVRKITGGLGRTTIWREERQGNFPRRRHISAGTVGWLRSEVVAWATSRPVVGAGKEGNQ